MLAVTGLDRANRRAKDNDDTLDAIDRGESTRSTSSLLQAAPLPAQFRLRRTPPEPVKLGETDSGRFHGFGYHSP